MDGEMKWGFDNRVKRGFRRRTCLRLRVGAKYHSRNLNTTPPTGGICPIANLVPAVAADTKSSTRIWRGVGRFRARVS